MGCCSSSVAAARGESAPGGATPYGTVAPTQKQLANIVGKKWADVRDNYAVGKVIGEGSFGKVHMCTEVATGVERVVKVRARRPALGWSHGLHRAQGQAEGGGGAGRPTFRLPTAHAAALLARTRVAVRRGVARGGDMGARVEC